MMRFYHSITLLVHIEPSPSTRCSGTYCVFALFLSASSFCSLHPLLWPGTPESTPPSKKPQNGSPPPNPLKTKTRVGSLQRFPFAGLPPLSTQTPPHQGQSPKTLGQIRTATNLPSGRRGGSARSPQPLVYSFGVQNVLQPYRSRLDETNDPSSSFCYLDGIILNL
jgi:hypothetical protein